MEKPGKGWEAVIVIYFTLCFMNNSYASEITKSHLQGQEDTSKLDRG